VQFFNDYGKEVGVIEHQLLIQEFGILKNKCRKASELLSEMDIPFLAI
jgi:hypothetical protein